LLATLPDTFGTWLTVLLGLIGSSPMLLIASSRQKRNVLSIGVAAIIWEFWKARNLACFEKKWLREPIDIIHCVVYWINY
jgi:hypothetical protein